MPYIGEIRMFAGNFAPSGWAFCDGQLIPIVENETLFTLIGTIYGGDGLLTFGLPDLRGRVPVHFGLSYQIGEFIGVEQVTLSAQQYPNHTHLLLAASEFADQSNPANNYPAQSTIARAYSPLTVSGNMAATTIGQAGGSQPHNNLQPYLCINFIISLFGVFPTQN